ncbi:hypothetical protein LCGC14_1761870 [marine sediment metagenome]|uniref:Uncharacterized protein n=1 Tax=marine sediment metagenome TaxID=412755 RepID=A0A0F9JFT7_9ZZZZ
MIYQVKVFNPKGGLRKTVSSKKLCKLGLERALSKHSYGETIRAGFVKRKSIPALKSWRELNFILDGISIGRSER